MDADTARRLNALAGQLAEALMTAAICAREIQAAVRTEIDEADLGHRPDGFVPRPPDPVERPLLDESTLSVIWKGKTLHLGNTLAFRLLERLARCPNQYVTHLDLLRDVWEDEAHGHRDHPQPRPATPPQAPRRRLDRSGGRDSRPQRALRSAACSSWPADRTRFARPHPTRSHDPGHILPAPGLVRPLPAHAEEDESCHTATSQPGEAEMSTGNQRSWWVTEQPPTPPPAPRPPRRRVLPPLGEGPAGELRRHPAGPRPEVGEGERRRDHPRVRRPREVRADGRGPGRLQRHDGELGQEAERL